MKLKLPIIAILLITAANINAAHHEEDEKLAAQGLISSEVFDYLLNIFCKIEYQLANHRELCFYIYHQ